jgi:hypothetical protein
MILRPSYRRYQSSTEFFSCVLLFKPISLTHLILRRPKEDYLKFSPSLFTCISYSSGPLGKEYGTKIPPFAMPSLLHVGFQVQAKTVAPKSYTMWSHTSIFFKMQNVSSWWQKENQYSASDTEDLFLEIWPKVRKFGGKRFWDHQI